MNVNISETFQWLQFSDFHIKGSSGPQLEALQSLLDKVKLLCQNDAQICAIFLVGDIAFSGKASEYAAFGEHFLLKLREIDALRTVPIYVVPGNHDVDCDSAYPIVWDSLGPKRVAAFFCEDAEGKLLRSSRAKTMAAYWEFVEKHGLIGPNPLEQVSTYYSLADLPFDILATNTSFFSDYAESSSKPITPIPLSSLRQSLSGAAHTKPVFILGHHSMSSFRQDQTKQLKTLLREKNAVYFHGHEHKPQVAFNSEGNLSSLGFGASYLTPLISGGDTIYKNSFTFCRLNGQLNIQSFCWEADPGQWIDSTEVQLGSEIRMSGPDGKRDCLVSIPIISNFRPPERAAVFSKIPRTTAKPDRLIPVGSGTKQEFEQIFMASDSLSALTRKEGIRSRSQAIVGDKAELIYEDGNARHLIVLIAAINHILSSKEIEAYNTRLDTEDLESLTILSLGKITDEAHALYLRLRSKKPIEVMTNADLTERADSILSREQKLKLNTLDSATNKITLLLEGKKIYVLVTESGAQKKLFYIVDDKGGLLASTESLVTAIRLGTPEYTDMQYLGEERNVSSEERNAFDEELYLISCHKEYNAIKYAALASVGIRFTDLPLEDLYVEAIACEATTDAPDRLDAVVGDHLAALAVTDSLKSHIKQQLLQSLDKGCPRETSQARSFCQKYGAVLITGDPGSGKTCFVKNEILSYCSRSCSKSAAELLPSIDWYNGHVPIMVQLSEIVAEADLKEAGLFAIVSRVLARKGLRFLESDIEAYSRQGRIAWFFDGLDEVVSVERRAAIVQEINVLVDDALSTGNRVVVTSRPAAIQVVNLLPSLHKLEIQGLSDEQITTLAERILRLKMVAAGEELVVDEGPTTATHRRLIQQLLNDCKENPGVARLAQNPLLLTLLIMIYANAGAPSAKRHLIYEQAIQTLASVRGREAGHQPISAQDLRERLGAVAVSVYRKESGLLPSRLEVAEIIKTAMSRQRGEPVELDEAYLFIQKVAESTGLIAVECREGQASEEAIVTFMHHSFLEYFAAIGLSREIDSCNIEDLVAQPRWHEILTLLSGIIGDASDVAPILNRFLGAGSKVDDVDAKLLTFAIDCALESDVPSEAALRLLARAVRDNVISGPAKVDPWVREELGSRIKKIFMSCGADEFGAMLGTLIRDPNAEICAAAIDIAGYACDAMVQPVMIRDAIETLSASTEELVLCAICTVLPRSAFLQTSITLEVIKRCLSRSNRCRKIALNTIALIPHIASLHWDDIIAHINSSDSSISKAASRAALRAGLNTELISLSADRKSTLLTALRAVGLGEDFRPQKVRIEIVERLWDSPSAKDRLLAIQLLPRTNIDEQELYQRLVGLIGENADREEVVASLTAIRESNAKQLFKLSALKAVIYWLKEGSIDVRIAALKLLRHFAGHVVAVEAILATESNDMSADEYAWAVHVLGASSVLEDVVQTRLHSELKRLTGPHISQNNSNNRKIAAVLSALRQQSKSGSPETIQLLRKFYEDYRVPVELKKSALLCLPAITDPSVENINYFADLYKNTFLVGLEDALVAIPSTIAQKCKSSVDIVVTCVGMLSLLREAAVNYYSRISKRKVTEDLELQITSLRAGITELSQIIIAFDDFIDGPKLQ